MRKWTKAVTTEQEPRLAKGVVVERLESTVLVMIPGQHNLLTLTGPAADVVTAVVARQYVSQDFESEVELLVSAGVLAYPMSRRSLLKAGAIGAGAGIAVLSMPGVAAASSPDPDPDPVPDPVFIFSNLAGSGGDVGGLTVILRDEPQFNDLATGGGDEARLTNDTTGGHYSFRNNTGSGPRVFVSRGAGFPLSPLSSFQDGSGVTFTFTFQTAPNNAIGPLVRTL